MDEYLWRTGEPVSPDFARQWRLVIDAAPSANFTLDLDHLAWESRHGRPMLAALVSDGNRRGALVLRPGRSGWVSGWPWRWQAVVEQPARPEWPVPTPDEAAWLFQQAVRIAGGQRLRCFLPVMPAPGVSGYASGTTILQSIDHFDDELLRAMESSKRRMVRRALDDGYEVIEATAHQHYRVFAELQVATQLRHGQRVRPLPTEVPASGESWREWELPWMWLLVALRDGQVESGLGDGVIRGGLIEGRTGASSLAARRSGAFALLCLEEAKRGRDRGHRWLNHGGDTPFKREVAGRLGTSLPIFCWLGGGSRWRPLNRAEELARGVRPATEKWLRRLRRE